MTYTPPYVPNNWVNGSAPGISAAALNQIDGFIEQIDASTVTTITGGTNGTCDCYQPLQGNIKMVVLIEKNFRTGGSNQTYTLPVAFTTKGFFVAGDTNSFTFTSGGTGQNVDVITSLASGGGSSSNVGSVSSHSFGGITHAFDTISFNSGAGSNHNSTVIIIGV